VTIQTRFWARPANSSCGHLFRDIRFPASYLRTGSVLD
jgi:hypothetical protein